MILLLDVLDFTSNHFLSMKMSCREVNGLVDLFSFFLEVVMEIFFADLFTKSLSFVLPWFHYDIIII